MILYELLTSRLPFSRADLKKAGLLEIQRRIREEEPLKPSTRLTSAGTTSTRTAEARRTSAPGLLRAIRGDLDWITLKAMEKDRTRRYATAVAVAEDVDRHLKDEPVMASPPSISYRLKKYVRRYRARVTAAATIIVALIAAIVGTSMGLLQAERQRKRAEAALESLRGVNRILGDVARLRNAELREQQLYPAWPEVVDHMRAWLVEIEDLQAQTTDLQKTLVELRARASGSRKGLHGEQIFDFESPADRFLHTTLATLIADLLALGKPDSIVSSVRDRLQWAEQVKAKSIDRFAREWSEAQSAIRASSLYDNFALRPQVGLVPVGPDPQSKLWEFVHLRSGRPGEEVPARDAKSKHLLIRGGTGIVFVLLPGGSFSMGAQSRDRTKPNYDPNARPNEVPVHSVSLTPFFIAKYEITSTQWSLLSGIPQRAGLSQYVWVDGREY